MRQNIKDLFVPEDVTIRNAMKQMNATQKQILLVIQDIDVLLGTITDGDIRRWLLANGDLDQTVGEIYNRNAVTVPPSVPLAEVKSLMIQKGIRGVPAVDEQRRVRKMFFFDEIFSEGQWPDRQATPIPIPVVIMAGGKGDRLDPFTKILPKPLIPIGDIPMAEVIINSYVKQGFSDFHLVLNYKGEMVRSYFESAPKDCRISFVNETRFLGTAGGLKLLEDQIGDTFVLSNCDVIVRADFAEVIRRHKEEGALVTVLSSIQYHKIPYGVIEFKNGGEVLNIQEKPEYVFTVNTGVYVLDKKALSCIAENSVFHMTDLVDRLIKNKKKVMTYLVNENDYIDIGQWDLYKEAVRKLNVLEE